MSSGTAARIFHRQGWHLISWLAVGALLFAATRAFPEGQGRFWGLSTGEWIGLSWMLALLHQGWIFFFWRLELHGRRVSRWFGRDRGFRIFEIGFVVLGPARLLMVGPIAFSSAQSLPIPLWLGVGYLVVTTALCLFAAYSAIRYFGVHRACGADHFYESYQHLGLETRGIHGYSSNAYYHFVLPALYQPSLLFGSWLGLLAALAHHALIWVAYACTEKPDMRWIYGDAAGRVGSEEASGTD